MSLPEYCPGSYWLSKVGQEQMAERRTQLIRLVALAALLVAFVGSLDSPNEDPKDNVFAGGYSSVAPVSSSAFQDVATPTTAPAPGQPTPTGRPLQAEVLPPEVSPPATSGRGLFDEITDRLLRALLNF